MKKLSQYVLSEWKSGNTVGLINEYRTKGSVNKKNGETPDLDDLIGKDEDENGSDGEYSVEPPTEDDILKGVDRETLNKNKKRILMRLKAKKPFFVQGEAGWGKTSIITKLAHQCGYTVLTVYLDKAEATDLGGIPIPKKSRRGGEYVKHLLPEWASVMFDNKSTKFLLFFDEMNQAAPDVMNALMPIVLKNEICGIKFENFVVAGAGNFESENGAVSELSGPLLSRFGGVITWISDDWKSAFKHLHGKWDRTLGKDFINELENAAPRLFKNPRDVESFILDITTQLKEAGDVDYFDTEDYFDTLENIAKDNLSRSDVDLMKKVAEKMHAVINKIEVSDLSNKKEFEGPQESLINMIKMGIKRGYIKGEKPDKKYGISRENIFDLDFITDDDPEKGLSKEMYDRVIKKLINDGIKFKYEKDEEWKKAGFLDPSADEDDD